MPPRFSLDKFLSELARTLLLDVLAFMAFILLAFLPPPILKWYSLVPTSACFYECVGYFLLFHL